ncbi:bis(5'-adenosyl)-triphosphatase enpp4-like [Sitodiplosis mosellana]|uniref:bis(5'-adenosyl)-triphosphatase enpp4-like n=1 Tax=Sitodiplosis mosellana TaxID=263140 RepID=UPI00244429BB|nr:bis(5'-adenosyl)-triphosphatase enpp4-like [Sitodiplosis mosellana]
MNFTQIAFYWMFANLCGRIVDGLLSSRKLILISFDAFKPTYLDKQITPFMEMFYKNGVRATRMNNTFPTKTFVNHFSIATGLNPQNHGVTGNEVYDRDKGFIKYSYPLFHYNESVVPIWRLNEDQNGRTGVMMWPGSDFAYQGKKCAFEMSLDKKFSLEDRTDVMMKWLKNGANFVMFYVEEPDEQGHRYGPDSQRELDMVKRLDAFVVYLEQSLLMEGLDTITDIIILSDHGMLTVTPRNFIDLYAWINANKCKTYGTSPVLQVICSDGKANEACKNLTEGAKTVGNTFNAYTDEQLLDRWFVRNQQRFGPCVVVAEPGYAFQDMFDLAEWFFNESGIKISMNSPYGVHGYDNWEPSMKPFFIAKGPSFKSGVTIDDEFSNIDLYYLFCKLLGIKSIQVDGVNRHDIWQKMLTV